jgi:quercetin dioxygenase-like cupin family protein
MKQIELSAHANDFGTLGRTTQLIREGGLRSFLLHLRANEEMPEHKVKGPITVQCLQGSVLFRTATEDAELITGSLISLPGEVSHSLFARRASLMLVTVFEQSSER